MIGETVTIKEETSTVETMKPERAETMSKEDFKEAITEVAAQSEITSQGQKDRLGQWFDVLIVVDLDTWQKIADRGTNLGRTQMA